MQKELNELGLWWDVRILGVNWITVLPDDENGNAGMTEGRDIPWLQDTVLASAWHYWNVTYRDVVILNELNVPVATFNLTEHNLTWSENYEALKALLIEAAGPPGGW